MLPAGLPASAAWRPWAIAMAVIALWQLGWAVDLIPPIGLPSPLEIGLALWHLVDSGELWFHLEATLPRLAIGWLAGTAIAVAVVQAARRWPAAGTVARPVVAAAGSVPAIALLPLFMIWLGTGEASMIATTALAAFAPAARVAADPAGIAAPPTATLVATLRAALPLALAVLLAVEMIDGGFGLGALVHGAAELYRSDQIIAGCLVIAAIWQGLAVVLAFAGRSNADRRGHAESR